MSEEKNLFKEILDYHKAPAPKSRKCTGEIVGLCAICKKPVYDTNELILLPSSNDIFSKEILVCSKQCGFEHYELIMYTYRDEIRGWKTLWDWSNTKKGEDDE